MRRSIGLGLIICLLFTMFMCGCGGKDKGVPGSGSLPEKDDSSRAALFKDGQITYVESPQKEYISGDYAVEKDGWIYYRSNSKSLEKMKNDGSGRVKLCDGEPRQIIIAGDWIYFSEYAGNGIFRVKTDGQEFRRLSALEPEEMTIEGDWIYFVSNQDQFIYRVKTDGTAENLLNDQPSLPDIGVAGDTVYFFKEDGQANIGNTGDGLYKMKTDGTGKILLDSVQGFSSSLSMNGDWIYYLNSGHQYKIRSDGTEKTKTHEGSLVGAVYKDWFYFRETGDFTSLYRTHLDGTDRRKIIGNTPSRYRFKNNYIFYLSESNNQLNLFRIKTDGSDMKQLASNIRNYALAGDWIYCLGMKQNYMFSADGTDREVLASSQAVNQL